MVLFVGGGNPFAKCSFFFTCLLRLPLAHSGIQAYDSLLQTNFPPSMATFSTESLGYMYLLSFVHQWETLSFGLQYTACTLLSKIQEA